MHIVIDTTPLIAGHKTRGIGRYTRNLVEALQELHSDHQLTMTSDVGHTHSVDLVHYPYFELFQNHLPFLPPGLCEVVSIHDLIPLRFPDSYKPGLRSGLNLWIQTHLIQRASAIITDSQSSAGDIKEFLSIPDERVFVVPLGVEPAFEKKSQVLIQRVKQKYHLPDSYLLYVGDVNVNKNLPALIEAIAKIPNVHLVLVSRALRNRHLPEVQLLHKLVEKLLISDRIREVTDVPLDPIDDLAAIYSGAIAYVQPSLYEGFGLPVLEAMACGTPVISTKVASLPEVAGDAALFSGTTVMDIQTSIVKLLSDSRLRKTLSKKGLERAEKLNWHVTAQKTMDIYESVFRQKSRIS